MAAEPVTQATLDMVEVPVHCVAPALMLVTLATLAAAKAPVTLVVQTVAQGHWMTTLAEAAEGGK